MKKKCKLWDDDPHKSIYHCNDCGICRIGKGLGKDFFHCKVFLPYKCVTQWHSLMRLPAVRSVHVDRAGELAQVH